MRKSFNRLQGLAGYIPTADQLKQLIPVGLGPIKVTSIKPISTSDILAKLRNKGMLVKELAFPLFRSSKSGKPPRLDNEDLVVGWPQYGTGAAGVESLVSTWSDTKSLASDLSKALKPLELFDSMESDDLEKLTILRRTPVGQNIQTPMDPDQPNVVFPKDFVVILKQVIKKAASVTSYRKVGQSGILDGIDAKDTALGSPTFYAGEAYHAARLATLAAVPVPDYKLAPDKYLDALEHWAGAFMPDPSLVYASYLSYRFGPTTKPTPLWVPGIGQYSATHEATSLYPRRRAVWAAAQYINVILTPLVLALKSSRKNIPGLWHDPMSQSSYISKMQKQGSNAYEVDYSSYDLTLQNRLLVFIFDELADNGVAPWEARFCARLLERMGAIVPSFSGANQTVTYFQHMVTLLSGLLPTSESGSLISTALVLFGLSRQIPDITSKWLSGSWVMALQSDDVTFALNIAVDKERFKETLSEVGIKAKIKDGSTFLKRILPIGQVKVGTKMFSRNLQQTVANEDSYDGKPTAILRLGLAARCDGLQTHPLFSKFFPRMFDMYREHFDYVKEIEKPQQWLRGSFELNKLDMRSIEAYATGLAGSTYLSNLLERSSYDPAAAALISFLTSHGQKIDFLEADQRKARAAYTQALFSPPSSRATQDMLVFARWRS